jgi:hypothetical protein
MFDILRQKPPSSPSKSKARINDEDDALTGEGLTKEAIKAHVPGSLRKAKVRTGHVCAPARGPRQCPAASYGRSQLSPRNVFTLFYDSIHCAEVHGRREPGRVLRLAPARTRSAV